MDGGCSVVSVEHPEIVSYTQPGIPFPAGIGSSCAPACEALLAAEAQRKILSRPFVEDGLDGGGIRSETNLEKIAFQNIRKRYYIFAQPSI